MKLELIIGVAVSSAFVVLGVHFALHKLLKFKMDESVILRLLKESYGGSEFRSIDELSAQSDITIDRIRYVCNKSSGIQKSPDKTPAWRLK